MAEKIQIGEEEKNLLRVLAPLSTFFLKAAALEISTHYTPESKSLLEHYLVGSAIWDLGELMRNSIKDFINDKTTKTYNFFESRIYRLGKEGVNKVKNCDLPKAIFYDLPNFIEQKIENYSKHKTIDEYMHEDNPKKLNLA